LAPYDAHIERVDTQRLDELPGGPYDLVHVDGQQDGDGSLHDLRLALGKAKFILVDGIFWTRQNLDASTHFLQKYRSLIEYAVVVPGYAGDLVVRVRDDAAKSMANARDHRAIRQEYTREYFLRDCGGYEAFKSGDGRTLADTRLVTVFEMGRPWKGMRVLDVGSGRGELAHACYRAGADVTGLDYSRAATDIAHQTYAADLGTRLQFVCEDVLDYAPAQTFDRIVATDFVEHIDPATLNRVLERLRGWLAPGGSFVLHTWPNRIAYERLQRERRERARDAGFFLPRNQRSLYEDLMHLNEHTPAVLRRALKRAFPEVVVWVGSGDDPAGGLRASAPTRSLLATNDSIYAVCSDRPIGLDALRAALTQEALSPDALSGVKLAVVGVPQPKGPGAYRIEVEVRNDTPHRLASLAPFPIYLSYHWYHGQETVVFDGIRTRLDAPIEAWQVRQVAQEVLAPAAAGVYDLVITLVQEHSFWLDAHSAPGQARIQEMVTG
jgi:2-polyprenyl-3-methyl-5-hydroxy-6-metoxy-1,4-benzoquinol methylase